MAVRNWFCFKLFNVKFWSIFSRQTYGAKVYIFLLFQAKFVELMCIRSESAEATESAVDAVVQVVKELVRKFCLIIVLLPLQLIRINFRLDKQL